MRQLNVTFIWIVLITYQSMLHASGIGFSYDSSIRFRNDMVVPDECKNMKYCTTKPFNYPEDRYDNLLQDVIPIDEPTLNPIDISRAGQTTDDAGCKISVEFGPIYMVRVSGNDWRNVIQAPGKNYLQRVRMEKCLEDEGCFKDKAKPVGYKVYCKQLYNAWDVYVEGANGTPEKIPVELPACCVCRYRREGGYDVLRRRSKPLNATLSSNFINI